MPLEESLETPSAQTRVFLQPIAAPSILGMFGLAGSTFMMAALLCRWFGSLATTLAIVPFAALFGGLAQFLAGMWAFKARDGVATAIHGMWGAFWIAFGYLAFFAAAGRVPLPAGPLYPAFGYWFIVLAAVTWACSIASAAENKCMMLTLMWLAAGSTVFAIGLLAGSYGLMLASGYIFLVSSFIAWYTASALMINEAFGREVWSLGRSTQARQMPRVSVGIGEPGVIRGQA